MFKAATEYALEHHLPVLYLAANSGARVGLADEVKKCLRVEWQKASEPQKGFKYLYLSNEDYQSITGEPQKGLKYLYLINETYQSITVEPEKGFCTCV